MLPEVVDVDDLPSFDKTAVDGRLKKFRLVGGGDEQAIPFALRDFIEEDIGSVYQGRLLTFNGAGLVGAAEG